MGGKHSPVVTVREVAESEGGDKAVVFSWARHRSDKEGDEYTITWAISSGGSLVLGPNYARSMELGWQAFALSLIQTEIDDEPANRAKDFVLARHVRI
jgi:hypothetical protein